MKLLKFKRILIDISPKKKISGEFLHSHRAKLGVMAMKNYIFLFTEKA